MSKRPLQHFTFCADQLYPEGTLSDVECRGVKVAHAFPGQLDNITLCCVGVGDDEVVRIPHDPLRPIEAKYTEGDLAILILPEKNKPEVVVFEDHPAPEVSVDEIVLDEYDDDELPAKWDGEDEEEDKDE
ncbi:MAG: hypothetical protein OEN50_04835 [Deltaproteobacteria bacterium]|nr:hypothetical protein [Deltaproteobacteria bacterium]